MGAGKRVLLIIAGGIAAYKALDVIRRGRERGLDFRIILTKGGAEFVTPLAVASLAGSKAYTELFSLTDEAEMGHIRLVREADLVLVAPATADLIAKMAHGLADDLASTALLANDRPVLIAPSMNAVMWLNPAVQANVATLRARGVTTVGPGAGDRRGDLTTLGKALRGSRSGGGATVQQPGQPGPGQGPVGLRGRRGRGRTPTRSCR